MIEVIAEIANAHQGNYKTAIKLAKQAFSSGADAVKFQIYFAEFITDVSSIIIQGNLPCCTCSIEHVQYQVSRFGGC